MLKHSLITKLLPSQWQQSQHIFSALRSRTDLIQWLRANLNTVLHQHGITPYNPWSANEYPVVHWTLPSSPVKVSCFSRVLLSCGQALDSRPLSWLLRKPVVTSHHRKPLPKRTAVNIQTNKRNSLEARMGDMSLAPPLTLHVDTTA